MFGHLREPLESMARTAQSALLVLSCTWASLCVGATAAPGDICTPCAVAWLLLLLSAIVHVMHYCAADECESDEDEPSGMYS